MVTRNADSSQGVGWSSSPSHGPHVGQLPYRAGNTVFKSGTLFISSKGIGWTSWKKRWFVLTQSSLVFFRSDPSLVTQKSGETNLTLGGIDLNNSGSVVVKADKKLLTVLFPDGRDGRTFTLKAETLEDLLDWKNALEAALEQAPSAAPVMGQNGILRNDAAELADSNLEQCRDKQQLKSLVVGRPILLALEDIDGSPSFLEKALKFLELYGVKEEGILRQAADVDDVERRVREYQEGKSEFSPGEDAHVIADCVKHVLRELPSSPVPAACCNALLEAYRSDRGVRVNAMCAAIAETFPEPNCRLLQRILKMMKAVASHKAENRMSLPAVAACMAPLLLRPLLAGDCELGNDFKMGGDGSVQLLQAAAAANHAQAIVITLLEEYNNIFEDGKLQDGSYSPEFYSDTEGSGSEDEGASYEDEEVTDDDDECNYSQHDFQADAEDDPDNVSTGTFSESIGNGSNNINDYEISEGSCSYESAIEPQTSVSQDFYLQDACQQRSNNLKSEETVIVAVYATQSCEGVPASTKGGIPAPSSPMQKEKVNDWSSSCSTSTNKQNEPVPSAKRPTVWGRTSAIKNLSPESIDYPGEDEAVILRLDIAKNDLQNRIAKEEKGNVILKSRLGRRKEALHDHRLALEQDVARLQEQLQLEIDLREALEAELSISSGSFPVSATIDCTIKSDLEEIAVADVDVINLNDSVSDLQVQLDQRQKNHVSVKDSHSHQQQTTHFQALLDDNRQEAIEITEPSHPHQRTRNTSLDGEDCENVRIQEHQSLSNKQASHKKLLNSLYDNHMKSKGVPATSSAMLPVVMEPAASSTSKKSSMKNTEVAPADCENLKTRERGSLLKKKSPMKQHLSSYSHSNNRSDPPSLLAKQPSQKQQLDLTSHNNTKSVGISTTASPVELIASSNTKTSGSKSEGTVSTSSALTKLTTRLNFLKERRIHIANELQNLDKARGLEGQSVGDPPGTSPK